MHKNSWKWVNRLNGNLSKIFLESRRIKLSLGLKSYPDLQLLLHPRYQLATWLRIAVNYANEVTTRQASPDDVGSIPAYEPKRNPFELTVTECALSNVYVFLATVGMFVGSLGNHHTRRRHVAGPSNDGSTKGGKRTSPVYCSSFECNNKSKNISISSIIASRLLRASLGSSQSAQCAMTLISSPFSGTQTKPVFRMCFSIFPTLAAAAVVAGCVVCCLAARLARTPTFEVSYHTTSSRITTIRAPAATHKNWYDAWFQLRCISLLGTPTCIYLEAVAARRREPLGVGSV